MRRKRGIGCLDLLLFFKPFSFLCSFSTLLFFFPSFFFLGAYVRVCVCVCQSVSDSTYILVSSALFCSLSLCVCIIILYYTIILPLLITHYLITLNIHLPSRKKNNPFIIAIFHYLYHLTSKTKKGGYSIEQRQYPL